VYAQLSTNWVHQAARWACVRLPNEVAVVLENWKSFGELPILEWDRTTAMVSGTGNVGMARI
jgi:hypothetical protein